MRKRGASVSDTEFSQEACIAFIREIREELLVPARFDTLGKVNWFLRMYDSRDDCNRFQLRRGIMYILRFKKGPLAGTEQERHSAPRVVEAKCDGGVSGRYIRKEVDDDTRTAVYEWADQSNGCGI